MTFTRTQDSLKDKITLSPPLKKTQNTPPINVKSKDVVNMTPPTPKKGYVHLTITFHFFFFYQIEKKIKRLGGAHYWVENY